MKTQIDLSELNISGEWYSLGKLSEGVNRVFRWIKIFRNGNYTWSQKELFIYVHNGIIVKNATDFKSNICLIKFNVLKNANGDSSKITFETEFELEILN
jgi:hypothetical protein